jgi:hypothetical protein
MGLRPRAICNAAIVAAVSLTLGGCSRHTTAPQALVSHWPTPDHPVNAIVALQWAWNHKDPDLYSTLFTADYTFKFAELDSAGHAFRDKPWIREDELAFAEHLFVGGSSEPPADRITVEITNPLRDFDDHRSGKNPVWHREMRVEVNLFIIVGGNQMEIRGPGLFYLVRGDSAAVPQDLAVRGWRPDSTRWWIERWEDETLAPGAPRAVQRRTRPADTQPTHMISIGAIKGLYR